MRLRLLEVLKRRLGTWLRNRLRKREVVWRGLIPPTTA